MRILKLASLFLPLTTATAQQGIEPSAVTLSPGDLLRIEIWREEDLSGEFLIDDSGVVTLPMLGPQPVSGRPFSEVRDDLVRRYRVELRNPSISLTPLRRIYVLGEVNEPGLYTVDPTISLAGAVATAGGANPQGDLGRLRVVRDGRIVAEQIRLESPLSMLEVRSGDQIFVDRRSWFDRNSTFVVSALLSVTSLAVAILR